MRKLLIFVFLLLITGFSMLGFSRESHSINNDIIEMEQDQ
ncbi:hypothetical protein JOD18_004233 [Gracilibacillus alcaliphilus]|nr:hypothetical protein [Gracilibacillus alcaliphilus]